MNKLKKAFKKDNIKVKSNGILDNLNLHWANEAARHKLLRCYWRFSINGYSN